MVLWEPVLKPRVKRPGAIPFVLRGKGDAPREVMDRKNDRLESLNTTDGLTKRPIMRKLCVMRQAITFRPTSKCRFVGG
jgi:hypothetical protein